MDTESQEKLLLREIAREFPLIPEPVNLAGRTPCGGDEYAYVTEFFSGRAWNEITLEDLRDTYPGPPDACLHFMSAEAFHYYLPTYLSIFLQDWKHADTVADAATFALVPTADEKLKSWQTERFKKFTLAQRMVILDFLEYAQRKYENEYACFGLTDALLYWREAI